MQNLCSPSIHFVSLKRGKLQLHLGHFCLILAHDTPYGQRQSHLAEGWSTSNSVYFNSIKHIYTTQCYLPIDSSSWPIGILCLITLYESRGNIFISISWVHNLVGSIYGRSSRSRIWQWPHSFFCEDQYLNLKSLLAILLPLKGTSYVPRSMEDFCPCCNLSKRTRETRYWNGTLNLLKDAGDNGCLRCEFLARCVVCVIPDAFDERSRFRAWNFGLCELTIYNRDKLSPASIVLDIFTLPGE